MQRVMSFLIDAITECDLFSSGIVLRYRKDDNFKTFTSGCLSFLIIGTLAAFFITNIIAFANKSNVNLSQVLQQDSDPTHYTASTDNFLFAVGVFILIKQLSGIDLNSGNRYFNIKVNAASVVNGVKNKPALVMQPCTLEQWSKLGDTFTALYNKLSFSQWICPAPGQTIELQGKFSSDIFKYIKVSVAACTGTVNGQGCRSAAEITNILTVSDYFNLNYYFVSYRKMETQSTPIETYMQDMNTYIFSPDMGSTANLYISTFKIDSDDSLLPGPPAITSYDGVFGQRNLPTANYKPNVGEYVKLYIRKSSITSNISRSYLKFDVMLSNVGGLFTIVMILFQLPLYYYNSYCYELSLASDLFTYEKKEDQQREQQSTSKASAGTEQTQFQKMSSKFNFVVYIAYLPFVLLRKMGVKPAWVYFSALYETMHEIRRMTDMCRMMQRFQYLDRVCRLLLDEDQRRLIHLQQKETIEEIRSERNHYKLYRKVAKEDTSHMPVISLVIRAVEHDSDNLSAQQRAVINAYMNLRTRKQPINQTIITGLDKKVISFINKTQKSEEESKKRKLAIHRSLTLDSRDGLNSSIMRLEDVPDSTEPTPVYRFNDHSPRLRY